jgi:hypothetical protein
MSKMSIIVLIYRRHKILDLIYKITNFDVNPVFGLLHRVDMSNISDFSEVHSASTISVVGSMNL